jgi:glycosyltransferase involved in cell wall biosynthesis
MRGGGETIRALWLLNHRTARAFDVQMLRAQGVDEVFTPKSFPIDPRWVSADVDYGLDATLTIPPDDLAVLNAADWYGGADEAAWAIANRHFRIAFIGFHLDQFADVTRHFASTVLLRAWGHFSTTAFYSDFLYRGLGIPFVDRIRDMGDRFWFAPAYESLSSIEHDFVTRRTCFLPLGMPDTTVMNTWRGDDARIFFVCPQIGTEVYYSTQYQIFRKHFAGLPYTIGGAQPVAVPDPNAVGYVPRDVHEENMRRFRLMFYSGMHPYHVHYHPFEAVRAGMPLVFMAGSLLDELGGKSLPGRCRTFKEARRKVERLLAGDKALAAELRGTQPRLLEKMRPAYCAPIWKRNFAPVLATLRPTGPLPARPRSRPKIAVLIVAAYRGGTLRAAKSIANALRIGSERAGEPADIVLGYLDLVLLYPDSEFRDLPPEVSRRAYQWQILERHAAQRILRYRGHDTELDEAAYCLPNDHANNFLDCDFWVLISDRFNLPLLPLKPHAMVIFDYIQRYHPILGDGGDISYLRAARNAAAVLVTTKFTRMDAAQYAGIDSRRIRLVPHILPEFPDLQPAEALEEQYFVWPTNITVHKNHFNSMLALHLYYAEFGGTLKCYITGVNTPELFSGKHPHLVREKEMFELQPSLQDNLLVKGELPDPVYQKTVAGARFLWHTASLDNGTFAAIEAASFGVPILSTRYPAMEEMNKDYDLNIAWCDPNDARDMAVALKRMEAQVDELRKGLPSKASLEAKGLDFAAQAYWQAVRECL